MSASTAQDPLASLPKPDDAGGGILNLMSSIVQARGGVCAHPELSLLPSAALAETTNLVLLVIDGLGDRWLRRHAPDGLLGRARLGAIHSVFPSTTAAAITTYLTAEPPLVHGITGWHTYFGELGCVMRVLPGTPRYGGVPYRKAGVAPERLFQTPSIFSRLATRSVVVAPHFIAQSDFNRIHTRGAEVLPHQGLRDLFRLAAGAIRGSRPRASWGQQRARASEPKYLYLYWPKLDTLGHEHGIESEGVEQHFEEIESALADFLDEIRGTDTRVLVCADHGQIDTGPADVMDLAEYPRLAEALLLPLCGEPRAAFCYPRGRDGARFPDLYREAFGERLDLIESARLVEAGFFGTGAPHPRLLDRIGDYCLIPRERGILVQRLPFEEGHRQIGVHGGLSPQELEVPLCELRAT